jgi:hypothetical protein
MLVIVEKRLLSGHFDTGGDEVQSLVQSFLQFFFSVLRPNITNSADAVHYRVVVADRAVVVRL